MGNSLEISSLTPEGQGFPVSKHCVCAVIRLSLRLWAGQKALMLKIDLKTPTDTTHMQAITYLTQTGKHMKTCTHRCKHICDQINTQTRHVSLHTGQIQRLRQWLQAPNQGAVLNLWVVLQLQLSLIKSTTSHLQQTTQDLATNSSNMITHFDCCGVYKLLGSGPTAIYCRETSLLC